MSIPSPMALLSTALLLVSCGGGQPGTPEVLTPTPVGATRSAEESRILDELNAARSVARSCGETVYAAAAPVAWNAALATAARNHASDMGTRGYFAHVTPEGRTLTMRAEAAGYTGWRELGENIAAGYPVDEVMQGWLDSTDHCVTVMDPKLREVGIAFVTVPNSPYGSYWVQDFGTR